MTIKKYGMKKVKRKQNYYMDKVTIAITKKRFKCKKKWSGEPAPICWKWYHNILPFLYKSWTYEVVDTLFVCGVSEEESTEMLIKEIEKTRND